MQGSAIDPPEVQERLWSGFDRVRDGWDVGANVGQSVPHMLDVAERVTCFEPAAESFAMLMNDWGPHPDVEVVRAALSDVDGPLLLVDAPAKMATGQLVSREAAPDWAGAGDWDLAGATERSVLAYTADRFARVTGHRPEFMKIDVEGHELRVLRGASEILAAGVQLLIEVHSERLGEQIIGLLAGAYRWEVVRHPHYAPDSMLYVTHFWLKCWPV